MWRRRLRFHARCSSVPLLRAQMSRCFRVGAEAIRARGRPRIGGAGWRIEATGNLQWFQQKGGSAQGELRRLQALAMEGTVPEARLTAAQRELADVKQRHGRALAREARLRARMHQAQQDSAALVEARASVGLLTSENKRLEEQAALLLRG